MNQDTKQFLKDLVTLALPVGFQSLVNTTVLLIDNIMVGSLGDAAISAITICGTFSWLAGTISLAFAQGATIYISRLWGKGDKSNIKKIFSFAVLTNTVIAFSFLILVGLFPRQILSIYSNNTAIYEPGIAYLRIVKYAYFLNAISFSITILLRSVRNVKVGFYLSIVSCLINIFFNWVFIYGNLGATPMGAAGAALATLIARAVELLIIIIYLFGFEKNLGFKLQDINPFVDREIIHHLITISWPLLITEFLANALSSVHTIITGHISAYYISANSIVHTAWEVPAVFAWGVSAAANIMIGNAIGAGDKEKARKQSRYFIATAIGIGVFTMISLQIILPFLLPFYQVSEETLLLARQMGYSASFVVLFSTFCSVMVEGVIKGGGNTKTILKVDLLVNWCIAIPLGLFAAFVLKIPAYLLYIVLRSGNIIKMIWSLKKLKNDDWIVQF